MIQFSAVLPSCLRYHCISLCRRKIYLNVSAQSNVRLVPSRFQKTLLLKTSHLRRKSDTLLLVSQYAKTTFQGDSFRF